MMRRLLPCLCLALLSVTTAFAQAKDYPKWDFTAAYTLNNFETPPPTTRHNFNGFTAAIGGNFRRWAAVEGDLTYSRGTVAGVSRSLFTYIVGPRFTKRSSTSKLQPFVHALIGGGRLTGFGASTNGWAGKFGGGLDIVAGKHIAVRVGQIDYYRYHGHLPIGLPKQRLDNAAFTFGIRVF
jgi:hypothetical protein